ncbi:hypothetical protein HDU97_000988 [Phlyctochytrium planicorne]|nr:hypothetical protein HDU97_000988 [Phlyctochytrium planicorne]
MQQRLALSDPSWVTSKRSAVKLSDPWNPTPTRYIYAAVDGSKHANLALEWTLTNVFRPNDDHLILVAVGVPELDVEDVLKESIDKLFGVDEASGRNAAERFALEEAVTILTKAETVLLQHSLDTAKQDQSWSPSSIPSYELVAIASDDPESAIVGHVERKDEASLRTCSRPEVVPLENCVLVITCFTIHPFQ